MVKYTDLVEKLQSCCNTFTSREFKMVSFE